LNAGKGKQETVRNRQQADEVSFLLDAGFLLGSLSDPETEVIYSSQYWLSPDHSFVSQKVELFECNFPSFIHLLESPHSWNKHWLLIRCF
jgi:hypothetical protein